MTIAAVKHRVRGRACGAFALASVMLPAIAISAPAIGRADPDCGPGVCVEQVLESMRVVDPRRGRAGCTRWAGWARCNWWARLPGCTRRSLPASLGRNSPTPRSGR